METNSTFKTIRKVAIAIMGILLLVFIFQNFEKVQIQFFTWHAEIRIAFLIFISLLFGAIITALISLPAYLRDNN